MFKQVLGFLATAISFGFVAESQALSMIVDAHDQMFVLVPPDTPQGNCEMIATNQSPVVRFDKGSVGAVHLDIPLPKELISNRYDACTIAGNRVKYTFTFKLLEVSAQARPIANITVRYNVDFNGETAGARTLKRINYVYSVTMQPPYDGYLSSIKLSCNDPQDPTGCPGMVAMNLPDEFQYNPFDMTAYKYFPYSIVLHVDALPELP